MTQNPARLGFAGFFRQFLDNWEEFFAKSLKGRLKCFYSKTTKNWYSVLAASLVVLSAAGRRFPGTVGVIGCSPGFHTGGGAFYPDNRLFF